MFHNFQEFELPLEYNNGQKVQDILYGFSVSIQCITLFLKKKKKQFITLAMLAL